MKCVECRDKVDTDYERWMMMRDSPNYPLLVMQREKYCVSCGLVHDIYLPCRKTTLADVIKILGERLKSSSFKERAKLSYMVRKYWNENYKILDRRNSASNLLESIMRDISSSPKHG